MSEQVDALREAVALAVVVSSGFVGTGSSGSAEPHVDAKGLASHHVSVAGRGAHGAEELLARARARIERLDPRAAWEAARRGEALLVDIRSADDRHRDGIVPGSLHIPRTVLEWRVDPTSEWRNPHVGGRDRRLVLICAHGFSSSLAAATLVDLGFERAGDVEGGFEAWRAAGLPVRPAREPSEGALPGLGPPDDWGPEGSS